MTWRLFGKVKKTISFRVWDECLEVVIIISHHVFRTCPVYFFEWPKFTQHIYFNGLRNNLQENYTAAVEASASYSAFYLLLFLCSEYFFPVFSRFVAIACQKAKKDLSELFELVNSDIIEFPQGQCCFVFTLGAVWSEVAELIISSSCSIIWKIW